MSLWRQLTRGLRALTRREATDADVTDELRHYLDLSAASHERRGLAPDAARRAAQLEMGNMTVAREQVRSYGWENAIEGSSPTFAMPCGGSAPIRASRW